MALADNLVHYWKFDESSGNAADSVGSTTWTNNGTVTYESGGLNNAARTSSGKYFSITGNFGEGASSGGAFSFSFWFKPDALSSDRVIFGRFSGTKLLQIYTSGPTVKASYGTSPYDTFGTGTASTSAWNHVVFTFSSSGVGTIYFNGSSAGSDASPTGAFNDSTALNIGRRGGDGAATYSGLFDEFGWWERELTSGEVTTLQNSGTPYALSNFYTPPGGSAALLLANAAYFGRQL